MKTIVRWSLIAALVFALPLEAAAQLTLVEPENGSLVSSPPVFTWAPTSRAEAYLFLSFFYYDAVGYGGYIPHFLYLPGKTSEVVIQGNLDSGASVITDPFDPDDVNGTSNFDTTVIISDSLGERHPILLCFRKLHEHATGNSWAWYAAVQEEDAASGFSYVAAEGTLGFDTEGALLTQTTSMNDFNFAGGSTQNQVVEFDFGTSLAEGGSGLDGITQFGADNGIYLIRTDDTTLLMPFEWWNNLGTGFPCYWALLGFNTMNQTWVLAGFHLFVKVRH